MATDVVVIGGGLAGLTAAYELQKLGVRAHLLEERSVLGGRVATAYYNEHLNDEYGMQEIWQNNHLLELAHELGVEVEAGESAFSSVVVDGAIWPFDPNQARPWFDKFLSPPEAIRLRQWLAHAKELAAQARQVGLQDPEVRDLQERSFASWVQKSGLAARSQAWLRLTVECEMAADWQNFSALSALLDMDMFFDDGSHAG